MSGLPSDEVAEDYKSSLEDLVVNDKFQIGNLTVIAKENIEHAMAISRVLENHIRTVPPPRKLPALYVLDSIVKNVGTPYTLILGRDLFKTFMSAYTVVDSHTRKKLDEMLATWKQPIPGSLDNRAVFPPETTRNIENALIKARTAALQSQREKDRQMMGRGNTPMGYRNTPTPPQYQQNLPPLYNNGRPQGYPSQNEHVQRPQSRGYQQPGHGQPQPERIDLDSLNRDIDNLIATTRHEFAGNPLDPNVQQRLKALLDLKSILTTQQLPNDQLILIRDQVARLKPAHKPTPPPQPAPQLHVPLQQHIPQRSTPVNHTPTPVPQQPLNLQALLNSGRLAEIVQAAAHQRQAPTPPAQSLASLLQNATVSTPPLAHATPAQTVPVMPPPNLAENPLIASLRAKGLLGPSATPVNRPASLAQTFNAATPPPVPNVTRSSLKIDVPLTNASIKIPRPSLIATLYDAKPNRCGTCGRRFLAGEEGKEQKARHLDWHFKTNQRMAEASRRGQNRSWYVDEQDWIQSREYDDDLGVNAESASTSNGNAQSSSPKKPKQQYISTPNDPVLRNLPCPICQEKFESTWSEEAQDWIWQDAVKKGNRVYHASCYAEVTKDGAASQTTAQQGRQGTPDSVLGKRKAEENEDGGLSSRIKTEGVAY